MSTTPIATLRVALPLPLPQLFDYLPPTGTVAEPWHVGCRLKVPFGPRELVGLVVALAQHASADGLRPALAWCEEIALLHGEIMHSLHWLARYTHAPFGEVVATALPGPLRCGEPLPETQNWAWRLSEAYLAHRGGLRSGSRPAMLAALLEAGTITEDMLDNRMPQWRAAARTLAKRGHIQRVAVAAHPLPPPAIGPVLNDEQQIAVAAICNHHGFGTFLLDGVTGSGKTEVYLQAIAACLAAGKQALVLVPEIGLTPQILDRFRARLGVPVHALHSGLSDKTRTQVWASAWRGEARLIVGTRSAVFTPLPHAGLIVVDEEHDGSYKQQDGIRYHARDFALVRGKALDVPVILGSATPSLESLHNAYAGRYRHLRLSQRAGNAQPPRVRVLDIRKRPLQDGLSSEVLSSIATTLARGEQVLVFKNRRGYAPVLLCHDCGWTAVCQRCSTPLRQTSMTVHANASRLQCHHCGARQPVPLACPACASLALQPQGIGTERLEQRLCEAFPGFPVVRIDRGTTQHRDALKTQLAGLGKHAGILVGTQILAKGHDLPQLTMVVVVGIDEGLFSADFRAAEKLSQQLIQVTGRAGRAEQPGEVWLQTHHPEHRLLQTLIHGGYHGFAEAELQHREAADFPPFTHLALFRAEAKDAAAANRFLAAVRALLADHPQVDCHGPMPAPMPRRAGYWRRQLLLCAQQRTALHRLLDVHMSAIHDLAEARKVRWSLDIDPVDLY